MRNTVQFGYFKYYEVILGSKLKQSSHAGGPNWIWKPLSISRIGLCHLFIIEWTEFQDFQIWKKNWPGVSHNGPVSPTIPLILKAYWRNMQFHGLFIIIEYICTLNEGQVFGRWVIWESLKLKLKCIDTSNSGLEKISFKIDQSAACTIAHHSLHTGFSMFFCKISTIL